MQQKRLTRKESQHQTRQQLLEAAARVFSLRGYHAASVDEIAAEAGFSKGAVYSNFDSKEDVLLELIDQRFERDIQEFRGIQSFIHSQPDPDDTSAFPGIITADRTWNLLLIEFFIYAMRDETIRAKVAPRMANLRQREADSLRELYAERNETPALPVDFLPWGIIALGVGTTIQFLIDPEALPDNLYERTLRHLLK